MTEISNRVSKAIEEAEKEWLRREGDAQDGLDEHNTIPLYVAMARAAIEAMREPTEAMKNCSEEVHWGYSCHVCGGLTEGWHKMIDAALTPAPLETARPVGPAVGPAA